MTEYPKYFYTFYDIHKIDIHDRSEQQHNLFIYLGDYIFNTPEICIMYRKFEKEVSKNDDK